MSAFKLAVTALSVAAGFARNPVVRAGVRAVVANPKLRDAAVGTTKSAAYNAGRLARIILPRKPKV